MFIKIKEDSLDFRPNPKNFQGLVKSLVQTNRIIYEAFARDTIITHRFATVRLLISFVIAGMQLELLAIPPFFGAPRSLGLIDLAL